jgi:hypothetical protein
MVRMPRLWKPLISTAIGWLERHNNLSNTPRSLASKTAMPGASERRPKLVP